MKPGGRFVAELGGKGNCRKITDALLLAMSSKGYSPSEESFPWFFPLIGELSTLLEVVGFHVDYVVHFERLTELDGPDGMINWMQMFSSNLLYGVPIQLHKDIYKEASDTLNSELFFEGHWVADYKRIRIIGSKV